MLNQTIEDFFNERKESWLKKNLKSVASEAEMARKHEECDDLFSLEKWLPDAAKRAGQMSFSTHPCTFSHPSARKNKNGYVTPVIAEREFKADGFLKTGSVEVEADALGNAAALDVFKFLSLVVEDKKLINHIEQETNFAKKLLSIESMSYSELRDGFLKILNNSGESEVITSEKIKQVFFPVGNSYHQLSILTNSGIVDKLKQRLEWMKFSEEVKELRELRRKNECSDKGYAEVWGTAIMWFGGTKPQNISVLNNKNGGKAYLLSSLPPSVETRSIHFPKKDFFTESLRKKDYADAFHDLHKVLKIEANNMKTRAEIKSCLQTLINIIIEKMWEVRLIAEVRYYDASQLSAHQKIWLDRECKQKRENEDDDAWLDKLINEMSGWVIRTYEKILRKESLMLGEAERRYIADIVEENKDRLKEELR